LTRQIDIDAQARKSALSVAVVLLLIAAWNVYRGRPTVYYTLGSISGLLLATGFFWRGGALMFHNGWMKVAHVLGWVNTRILLGVMFYGIFTPFGVVMRLFGRNPMNRRGNGAESYWIERPKTRQTAAQFERLF
jgi:hypothetical protein